MVLVCVYVSGTAFFPVANNLDHRWPDSGKAPTFLNILNSEEFLRTDVYEI